MRRRRSGNFRFIYFIYLSFLVLLSIAAVIYVRVTLKNYESAQPERQVERAIEELRSDALSNVIYDRYAFPEVEPGRFEENIDIKANFVKTIAEGELTYSRKPGAGSETELVYNIKNGDDVVAEVVLISEGEAKTTFAVLSSRDWKIQNVSLKLEKTTYTLSVPSDFSVNVNGIDLNESDASPADGGLEYKFTDMYLKPDLTILDSTGKKAEYTVKNSKIIPVLYNYSLTIPATLSVELNGAPHEGELLESGLVRHDIRMLEKPTVKLSDMFGNKKGYEGGNELELTYLKVTAPSSHSVKVSGSEVPTGAVKDVINTDFEHISPYVADLPQNKEYDISILKNNAEIVITDGAGNVVDYDKSSHKLDLTEQKGLDAVPSDVAAIVDPLKVAENWSLFMSNDLPFYTVSSSMIYGSYQHQVATKYANGIDITFTSIHTLANPAFTEEKVENFVWITDKCFSVDVSFVKHMLLSNGSAMDDAMNERMYFVYYDDTEDYVDNPAWKLASMKEIIE